MEYGRQSRPHTFDPTAVRDPGVDGISSTVHPVFQRNTPSSPSSARTVRRPASSTTGSAVLRLKSAGRSCCCGRRTPPKFCTSPQRGGAAAALLGVGMLPAPSVLSVEAARRRVLEDAGCCCSIERESMPRSLTVSSSLRPRVQRGVEHPVAHARWAVADGRHLPLQRPGQHLPRLSSLDRSRSAFLCGATVPARVRRVSDPRRRPPLGSGGSSRYCQSGRARGTLGHARSSAWHASVLSCPVSCRG